ncbi:MAG TPA: response regulator [Abditibacteriaceae bacterium]|jgi:PAS domain S-box-containing protein
MEAQILKILLIEDDEDDYVLTRGLISRFEDWQASVEWANSYETGLRAIERKEYDICLIDYRLGECDGLDLLRQVRSNGHKVPVIFLTGREQREADIAAMKAGAADYLLKDHINSVLLERSIRYAIEHTRTLQSLRKAVQESNLRASAINNLRSGVVITDPHQPDNPIVLVNPSFTTITGYSAEEACGRNCRFLQGPDTDAATVVQISEAIAARKPFRGLLQNHRKDGSTFCNGLVITPVFDDEGRLLNFVGLINDVSAPREQLRALAARLTQVREEERTQIAREIHDVLGQSLTGLKMDLSWLSKRAATVCDAELARVLEDKIRTMSQVVDSTIGTVRKIATELRPSLLDDLGLEAAAEWQIREFEKRSGIVCRLVSELGAGDNGNGVEISSDSSTALFRILQETLTNVARHAGASRVDVLLQVQGDDVLLQVRDNGRGITSRETSNSRSLGLLGMRERALLVGGRVEIAGEASQGTTVWVHVPLRGELPSDLYSAEASFRAENGALEEV